jgi:MSHA biogenesis protein MshO
MLPMRDRAIARGRAGSRGVTLVELVVAIVIAAGIGAILGVYLTVPVRSAADVARRAELTDTADTAVRRLQRDLGRALPNSVRLTQVGVVWYLEFIEVRTGGRYRAEPSGRVADADSCPDTNGDGTADEDVLTIGSGVLGPGVSDTCFRTLGTLADLAAIDTTRDHVVVYNVGSDTPGLDAYENGPATGGNKARVTGVAAAAGAENRLTLASNPALASFVFGSPANRFHVISGPVTYECNPGTGRLVRHSGYAITTIQPTAFAGAASALLANNVAACAFAYDKGGTQRSGLVAAQLTLTREGESVSLYHETHVDNVP